MSLVAGDTADSDTFRAIFTALERETRPVAGVADPRPLVVPLHDPAGRVTGGLWGLTLFRWLHLEMLVVPPTLRGQGLGTALVHAAEFEARRRGCIGIHVDTFSFQAAPFYQRLGFEPFGVLEDCPPGHSRLFLRKRLS